MNGIWYYFKNIIFNNTIADKFILKSSILELIFFLSVSHQFGKLCKHSGRVPHLIKAAKSLCQAAVPIYTPTIMEHQVSLPHSLADDAYN